MSPDHDGRPRHRKPYGLMQHIRTDKAPGKFPRVTSSRVIGCLRLIGKFILSAVRRLMTYAPNGRGIHEGLFLLREPLIGSVADRHSLRPLCIGGRNILAEVA